MKSQEAIEKDFKEMKFSVKSGQYPISALSHEAASLAKLLPLLIIEAKQLVRQLQSGLHGRRKPGIGEEFWEFRPLEKGEPASKIDWRRSAREKTFYVREKEQNSTSIYWIWVDFSPSMQFSSQKGNHSKRDRAILLALAIAELLGKAGENVKLYGDFSNLPNRDIIPTLGMRIMYAEIAYLNNNIWDSFPASIPLKPKDSLILLGDFIMDMESFSKNIAKIKQQNIDLTMFLLRDSAEEDFPFQGEAKFEDLEEKQSWFVGDAARIAKAYRDRISSITQEMHKIATKNNCGFIKHTTSKPAIEALLNFINMQN